MLRGLIEPGKGLKQRALRSAIWVSLLRASARGLSIVQTIVLARLLAPKDFGLYGIALLVLNTLDAFTQAGIEGALIQKEGDVRAYLDTAWTINVLRGAALALLMVLLAPLASSFFSEPRVDNVLVALAIVPFLSGLRNIGIVYFQKDLDFRKQFVLEVATAILAFVGTVVAAFTLRNVWALVVAAALYHGLGAIASFLVHPYRPKPQIQLDRARTLFDFGRWIFGTKILKLFIMQGDDAYIGRVLSATALGFYQVAYKMSEMPMDEVGKVVSSVTFPAFSKLHDRISELRTAYFRSLQLNSIITIPAAAGMIVLSRQIVLVLLGDKWQGITPVVQVLVVLGVLKHMGNFAALYKGVGRPDLSFYESIIRLSTMIAAIYPLTRLYGIVGTAESVLVATAIARLWTTSRIVRLLDTGYTKFVQVLLVPSLASLAMAGALALLSPLIDGSTVLGLATLVFVGVAIYLGAGAVLDVTTGGTVRMNIVDAIASL
jgi:lipopolysaccharide exporter